MKEWKTEVESTIIELEGGKPSADNSILLNALYGLRDRWRSEEGADVHSQVSPATEAAGGIDYAGHIQDELTSAEQYYKLWANTGDAEYKEFAEDELQHAEFWIRKSKATGKVPAPELQTALTWHSLITEKLTAS